MLKQFVKRTNERVRRDIKKRGKNTNKWVPVDVCEMKGIAGVLYLIGVYHCQHEFLCSLWSPGPPGRALFSAFFDRNRFDQLIPNLCFDSHEDRYTNDKSAPFRRMWKQFIENYRKQYVVGTYETVYEQLIPF